MAADRSAAAEITVDALQPRVVVAGTDVWLSRRDWQVLLVLARADGQVVSRDALYREVWGPRVPGHRDRSLDVYVRRLRARLADVDPSHTHIHTHHNIGYRLAAQPADGERLS